MTNHWLKTYPQGNQRHAQRASPTACKISHQAPQQNTTQHKSSTNRRGAARWHAAVPVLEQDAQQVSGRALRKRS
jgi:hypothetical protein